MHFKVVGLLCTDMLSEPVGFRCKEIRNPWVTRTKENETCYYDVDMREYQRVRHHVNGEDGTITFWLGDFEISLDPKRELPKLELVEVGNQLCTMPEIKATEANSMRKDQIKGRELFFIKGVV